MALPRVLAHLITLGLMTVQPFPSSVQVFAALSELESNHASERIRAGLQVAKAKGKTLGRPVNDHRRAKLARWDRANVPVKDQAKRLGVSLAAVYAMRKRAASAVRAFQDV